MKTLFPTIALLALTTTTGFAQEFRMDSSVRYTKTIVPNRLEASDSVSGKTGLDRRFFGDCNARIEYLFKPPFEPTIGCRIYKGSEDTSFVLEIKQVSNYIEVDQQLEKEFPSLDTRTETMNLLSKEEQKQRLAINWAVYNKRAVERIKRYSIEAVAIPISDCVADKLHDRIVVLLRSALPEGKFPGRIFDGETVTFRCVVDDVELWTLRYHVPEGDFKTLSDLFRRMIADVEARTFDEAKYIQSL